jgi:hypothetical protein
MQTFFYSQHTNPGVSAIIKRLRAQRLQHFDGMQFEQAPKRNDVVVYWGIVGPRLQNIITLNSNNTVKVTPGKLVAYAPPALPPNNLGDWVIPELGYRCRKLTITNETILHVFGKKVFLAGNEVATFGKVVTDYKTFTSTPMQRRIALDALRRAGLLFGAVNLFEYQGMTTVKSINTSPVLPPRYARMYGTRIANYIKKHYNALQQEAV